jgi:hypothetical protein
MSGFFDSLGGEEFIKKRKNAEKSNDEINDLNIFY